MGVAPVPYFQGVGTYTEKRLSGLVKVDALKAGESSHTHRVRAAVEVTEWFKGLTAEERGQVIAAAYQGQTGTGAATLGTVRPVLSLDGAEQLRVLSPVIEQRMRHALRWPAQNYPRMEALLSQGEVIALSREDGKAKWRTVQGDVIRRDTLLRLLKAGNLEVIE